MILLPLCLLLTTFWAYARGHCAASSNTFVCNATRMTEVITEFYEQSFNLYPRVGNRRRYDVYILDSSFKTIDYFPRLYIYDDDTINVLAIRNSTVEQVSENAFEEFDHLVKLDLSFNKLRNMSFVRTLPRSLQILHLSNNNITYFDGVFSNLSYLRELDLSYNRISFVDFSSVPSLYTRLNFSHNCITTLLHSPGYLLNGYLDLSYNQLRDFDETKLIDFGYLDISNNQLKSMHLVNNKHLLKLSYDDGSVPGFYFKNYISNRLLLSNSKFPVLNDSTLNIFHKLRNTRRLITLELSNCSITSISEQFFRSLYMDVLNLSRNNITIMGINIFSHSKIKEVDLSNSNILHIEKGAFAGANIEHINLSHNNLNNTSNICDDTLLQTLDLSFNHITTIGNYSLISCSQVFLLNLSNCDIQKIELQAFTGLQKIKTLDLSHNKLLILESDVFNNLPVKDLWLFGNKIDTIRNNAFNQLNKLQVLNLSWTGLRNLEPFAFANLLRIETIDLSNNNLTQIPHQLFLNVPNLKEVYLNGNNMTIFNFFDNRVRLDTLHLSFSGIFKPSKVFNLHTKNLYIRDSQIHILKKGSFVGLYNLKELRFNNSYVRMEPGALDTLFLLKHLDAQNLFRHDKVIRENTFSDLTSLSSLNLSHLSLEILETKAFSGMKNLAILLLNGNNVTKLNAHVFLGLEYLQILDLSSNRITSCDKRALKGLRNLLILKLQNNKLTTINSQILFSSLGNLQELHLNNNNISTMHIKAFSELKNLQELHLQSNAIKWLPIGIFQYLVALRILNLSGNNIEVLKTGAFSNLQNLKVLDLSNNELVNLENVNTFFSLKVLQELSLDGNHLKLFDYTRFLANARQIKYVGISHNKWQCDSLSYIIESFNNKSVHYKPAEPVYNEDNIDGIGCVDICKFVYCAHENLEQSLHVN